MNNLVLNAMETAYTAFNACDNAAAILEKNGFVRLFEHEEMNIKKGGKYYICRGGSSLIAFKIAENLDEYNFRIVASHLDSPALKLKYSPVMKNGNVAKLNVETYGGGINSTYLDVPLKIAGKIYVKENDEIVAKTYVDPHEYIIPNVAIHMNRSLNDGYKYNEQTDLMPLFGINPEDDYFAKLDKSEVVGYDLYAVNATKPFFAGVNDEFFCSPRIDNQVCAFSSVAALLDSKGKGVSVAFLADNEEIGSRSAEGADSDFLKRTLKTINKALGFTRTDFDRAIAGSFLVSADNAHAVHPNHPELSDPTNKSVMGGGIVIKHHANKNYTTDGLSSAVFEQLMQKSNVKTQHFFMRSDLRCGSTLGTISLTQLAMKSVDIGLGQLAMHSSLETMCASDVDEMVKGLAAFYDSSLSVTETGYKIG